MDITSRHKSIKKAVFLTSLIVAVIFFLLINIVPVVIARGGYKDGMCEELRNRAEAVKIELITKTPNANDDERIIVVNKSAQIIYDSSIYDNAKGQFLVSDSVLTALSGKEEVHATHGEKGLSGYIATPTENGAIYISKLNIAAKAQLKNLGTSLFVLSLIVAIVVILIATLGAKWFIHRINVARRRIERVRQGAFGEQMEIVNDDEISRLLKEINALSEQILETDNLRQTFVSDASHELRTPLSAIRLLMDSILQTENIDVETTREFMGDIGEQIDRLTRIAERLLTLTRLDGAKKLIFDPVDLRKTVESVIATLASYAEEEQVKLEYHLAESCIFDGTADGAYQIVFNLVENAIKYNKAGGSVRVYLFNREDECCVIVDDDGIGIPKEHHDRIFERFYRVDKARSRNGKGGTGLGLSIVSKLVENFDGTITVDESTSGGTRFTVTLPRYREEGEK